MSILLQQIRRSIYSRRGTAAALITPPPPHTVSRFYSTYHRALGPEEDEISLKYLGKSVLKKGLALTFILGSFHWVDYGGFRKRSEERNKLDEEYKKESESYYKVVEQLHDLRSREWAKIKTVK